MCKCESIPGAPGYRFRQECTEHNMLLLPAGPIPVHVADADLASAIDGSSRPRLYISGPMRGTPDDCGPWENIRRGMIAAQAAWRAGWLPLCPMLNAFWETAAGPLDKTAKDGASGWLDYDFAWVSQCHAVCRLPGKSFGGDREVEVAQLMCPWGVFFPEYDADGLVVRMPTPAEVQRNAELQLYPEVDLVSNL